MPRNRDKEKQKEYARNHYLKNKESMISRSLRNNKISIERNKSFIKSYLKSHPCIDCGEDNIIVLEFDHISSKTMDLSVMVHAAYSIKRIKQEIEKCEVRCANCHRIVTYNRRLSTQEGT